MKMIAVCPNNCERKEFFTSAHIAQEWLVNEHGDWIEDGAEGEINHPPEADNIWSCAECGSTATVTYV